MSSSCPLDPGRVGDEENTDTVKEHNTGIDNEYEPTEIDDADVGEETEDKEILEMASKGGCENIVEKDKGGGGLDVLTFSRKLADGKYECLICV